MKVMNILVIQAVFLIITLGCYVGNIARLVKCDWEPSYKAEVIYGVGVIAPTFYVTAFLDLESDAEDAE